MGIYIDIYVYRILYYLIDAYERCILIMIKCTHGCGAYNVFLNFCASSPSSNGKRKKVKKVKVALASLGPCYFERFSICCTLFYFFFPPYT